MNKDRVINDIVFQLDIPDSAKEKAIDRYKDLGEWLGRPGSECESYDPHVFAQGSFRLGTTIRPISGKEEYDLDLACKLRQGISASTHTQKDLKEMVGREVEKYRKARGIEAPLESKHRCWRLEYADGMSFHMDIVPCIPSEKYVQKQLTASMEAIEINAVLAEEVATESVFVTDDRRCEYQKLSSDWLLSNPEGYAKWFESKMHSLRSEDGLKIAAEAQVDNVPEHKDRFPLQRAIQILKRHRDKMFNEQPDSKPISVIITTISANAYSGSRDIKTALEECIGGLKRFSDSNSDQVPNPSNPEENFADRWSMREYSHLRLKENFQYWVENVYRDFSNLIGESEPKVLNEVLGSGLGLRLSEDAMAGAVADQSYGNRRAPEVITEPGSKPWMCADP